MSDPKIDEILERIENYDGTEEAFSGIFADALRLVPERPKLRDLRKEIARRCKVAVSTVGRYGRKTSVPGAHVRRFSLGKLKEILGSHRP